MSELINIPLYYNDKIYRVNDDIAPFAITEIYRTVTIDQSDASFISGDVCKYSSLYKFIKHCYNDRNISIKIYCLPFSIDGKTSNTLNDINNMNIGFFFPGFIRITI